jgi:hypothetical protein
VIEDELERTVGARSELVPLEEVDQVLVDDVATVPSRGDGRARLNRGILVHEDLAFVELTRFSSPRPVTRCGGRFLAVP